MPTAIAPEGFEAHEGFIAGGGPELACAFEAALVLTAGGLDGAGAYRLVGEFDLVGGGSALLESGSSFEDILIFHAVGVVFEVGDLGLKFLLLGCLQMGFDFSQGGNQGGSLIIADLFDQRCDPCGRLGSAAAVQVVTGAPVDRRVVIAKSY